MNRVETLLAGARITVLGAARAGARLGGGIADLVAGAVAASLEGVEKA